MADLPITHESLSAIYKRYFSDCQRLIDLLWPIAPLLRAQDPALGAIIAHHCESSLRLFQEYEAGAATPKRVRDVVTTFNHLVDQLEANLTAMFSVLFEYADSLLATADGFHSVYAQAIRQQVDVVRAALAKPGPSMEDIQGYYLRLEMLIAPLEQIVAALQNPLADSEQPEPAPALLVSVAEVAHG
jgi:hypothetical protein